MVEIFDKLTLYFSQDFVRYAMIVGILASICSALFGVVLLLKDFAFIGDGLAHTAFGAMAVAAVAGISDNMLIVMPVTIVTSILLLSAGKRTKIKGDVAVAIISAAAMAIGYLLLSKFPPSANVVSDVCGELFGSSSILTLTHADMIMCVCISAVVILIFVLTYNRMLSVTFDEDFARASGTKATLCNLIMATVTSFIIVIAMKLVGSLLVSALIIFPALSAMRVAKSFKATVITSAIISVVFSSLGLILAILLSTPVGPTIVCSDILAFAICFAVGKIFKR